MDALCPPPPLVADEEEDEGPPWVVPRVTISNGTSPIASIVSPDPGPAAPLPRLLNPEPPAAPPVVDEQSPEEPGGVNEMYGDCDPLLDRVLLKELGIVGEYCCEICCCCCWLSGGGWYPLNNVGRIDFFLDAAELPFNPPLLIAG
jgi:hypothetical protein